MSRCYGIFVYTMSKRFTTEEFIKKAREIHGDKYDYSKVKYLNTKTKICIICPVHGEFWQTPNSHLRKRGCPKCGDEQMKDKQRLSIYEFIEKAKKIHHNRYDYSKTEYINDKTKVCIICPEHGEFWQTPHYHTTGYGCWKCGIEKTPQRQGMGNDEFIKKSKLIHNHRYNYSKVEYKNNTSKVCIICPEHGEFWQSPKEHLNGCGCPVCRNSHLENQIFNLLKNNGYSFEVEKTFDWLKYVQSLRLDFFIESLNLAIECQGVQHFCQISDNDIDFENRKYRDKLKYELCKEHGIDIIYFSNLGIDYPYDVIEDIEELLKKIKEYEEL